MKCSTQRMYCDAVKDNGANSLVKRSRQLTMDDQYEIFIFLTRGSVLH